MRVCVRPLVDEMANSLISINRKLDGSKVESDGPGWRAGRRGGEGGGRRGWRAERLAGGEAGGRAVIAH